MYIANVTDDYNNMTPTNCTDNEYNFDIILPTLIFTIPCGLSFLCFMSLIVYTLIKTLFNKKKYSKWKKFYTHRIHFVLSSPD